MARMSPLDASFLHLENDVTHMSIASVSIFEGPPPPSDDLLRMLEGKLSLVPRYRQLVRFVPLDLGRPVWVDDPHFNLSYHVRRTALPPPGGEAELRNLVGRVMSQQLDRARPLWETWVVEGLSEGRWALLSKVHHSVVDGVSGTDLLTVVLDKERDPGPPHEDFWAPEPAPDGVELMAEALAERAVNPYEALRSLRAALRAPRQFATLLEDTARGLLRMRGVVVPTPHSSLNGPIGPHRRWSWARSRLSDVKTVRAALGGTVNDVVLTCITNGFRELLLSRGESADRVVRTLVPVSVRSARERGAYNNRVSAMFAELPVGIQDPAVRLASIRAQMADLKESKEAVAGEVLTSLSGFAPPMLLALGGRLAARSPDLRVQTGVTNVPGPQQPLQTLGRRLLESFPFVPLIGNVRISIAIFSYSGGLYFGVTGDYDSSRDIDVLTAGVERGAAKLLGASQTPGRAREVTPKRRKPEAVPRAHPADAPPTQRA
jgi:diacylglycerol O-acyltransferase / wax synthase